MLKLNIGAVVNVILILFFAAVFSGFLPITSQARNVSQYSDTISNSAPLHQANHTFTFTLKEAVAPSGVLTIDFPADFNILATSTFDIRNVELVVNGVSRLATSTADAVYDGVSIITGPGGKVIYTLNSSTGLNAEDAVVLKVGNHTTNTLPITYTYSTTTGTTTDHAGDIEPIVNSSSTGTHRIPFTFTGAGDGGVYGEFIIAIIDAVGVGPIDTTETIPPFRFNGAPTSTIGGTTLAVEISLETDEFAVCKWSQASGTAYAAMPYTFENTGFTQLTHSHVVSVVQDAQNTFYVRCIDDEGNFNIDDYIISFYAPPPSDGDPNANGDVEGDGSGTGNDGSEGGTGSGETGSGTGSSGGNSGGGGGGGGSGSGGGGGSGDGTGGGFSSDNGPYQDGNAQVIINGYAFPDSIVHILVDGYDADSERADDDGKFSLTVRDIARGAYTFGIYAVDPDNTQSSVFSTSFTVTGGRTSHLSNILITPSIKVTPDPVNPGEALTISGYALPNATVDIENQKDGVNVTKKQFTTTSDSEGKWSISVNTANFSVGTYTVKAKAKSLDGSIETGYSEKTFYGVGQEADNQRFADLNRDGKVNLIDFSILLFWWGTNGGDSDPPADINADGKVSLTDFSILLFQWTG